MKFSMLCLLLLASVEANSQIYKCEDSRGRLNFSDKPCAGNGSAYQASNAISVVDSLGPSSSVGATNNEQLHNKVPSPKSSRLPKPCKQFNSTELRNLMVKDKIVVGMTKANVERAWGAPTKINSSSTGHDQWVYRYRSGANYVYFKNGCVSSWKI